MIDGIRVLEEIHVVGSIGYIIFGAFFLIMFIILGIAFLDTAKGKRVSINTVWCTDEMKERARKEARFTTILAYICFVSGIAFFVMFLNSYLTTDYMKYRVFIEDSCSYNTFTSKYEVINTFDDGSVMIREKG